MPKDSAEPALFRDGELPPAPGPIESQGYEIWNEVAERAGWTKATRLTPERMKKIRRAVTEAGGLVGWREALERGAKSQFLTTKFRPDLEFATRIPKLLKMMEGGFDDQGLGQKATTVGVPQQAALNWRAILETYRPKGFWPSMQGNRPEDPGPHLAPAEMIEKWRKDRGLTQDPAPAAKETREERMAASIVSYRRIGQYDRANKIEEDLARLEGRPPVLVPSPEVADLGMPPKSTAAREKPSPEQKAAAVDVREVPPETAPKADCGPPARGARRWDAAALDAE